MVKAKISILPLSEGKEVDRCVREALDVVESASLGFAIINNTVNIESPDLETLFNVVKKIHEIVAEKGTIRIHFEFCLDHSLDEDVLLESKVGSIMKEMGPSTHECSPVLEKATRSKYIAKPRTIVVMPALNAEKTLRKTYDDIPPDTIDDIILVDDGSRDNTITIAKELGIKVYVHPQNRGYGSNQKTCYTMALNDGADIVVMIHPDYQYDSQMTNELIRPIIENRFDVMLGSRIRTRKEALEGGMPVYKYFANRFLTVAENIVLGLNLSEYHTGFRAFHKEVLYALPFHRFSDDFVFDQEILISASMEGYRIGEIPVPVRYFSEASSINFMRSVKYGFGTLITLVKYVLAPLFRFKIFSKKKTE